MDDYEEPNQENIFLRTLIDSFLPRLVGKHVVESIYLL